MLKMIEIMKPSKSEMRKWEVESAMSTLQRAEEIKKDKSLMTAVQKEAKKQAQNLMKLGGAVKPAAPKRKTIKRAPAKRTIKRKR